MKFKQLLTKTLLAAVCLLVGASNAWGASNVITYDLTGKFTSGTSTACTKTDNKITTPEAIATELNKNATYTFTWSGSPRAKGDGSGVDVSTSANGTFTIDGLSGGEEIIVKLRVQNNFNGTFTVAKGQKCIVAGVDVETTSAKTISNADGTYVPVFMKPGATSLTVTSASAYTILGSVTIITPNAVYKRAVTADLSNGVTAWSSDDIGTGKWVVNSGNAAIDNTYGLKVYQQRGSAKATNSSQISITDDYIVAIDAVWNTGYSEGGEGENNSFTIGNNIEIRAYGYNQNGKIYIGGVEYASISDACLKNYKRSDDAWTIHLVINTATSKIIAFTILGESATYGNSTKQANYTLSGTISLPEGTTYNSLAVAHNRTKGNNEKEKTFLTSISVNEYLQPQYAYTINYTYGGETITSEEGTAIEGTTVSATKASMWNEGNTKKYYVSGEATTSFVINDNASSNVFEVALREAETWNYTVNCIDGSSNILKSIIGTVVEEETAKVPYPNFINYNGTLYSTSAINSQYRKDFATTSDNTTTTITYSPTNTTDVIFYVEGEDIPNAEKVNTGGTYSRTSGCATAKTPEGTSKRLVTLPAGSYKATVYFYNSSSSGSRTVKITDGTNTLYTHGFGNGRQNYTSEESFALTETTTLYIDGGYSSANVQSGIDLVYITGTPDNEIIGALDKSTSSADNVFGSDIVLKKGDIKKITFKNHGSDYGKNWMLKYSYGGSEVTTIRADWFWKYEGDGNASKRLGLYTEPYTSANGLNWNTWTSDMDNSTVVLTVSNVNGIFAVDGTMTGSSDTYYLKYAYNNSFDGDITLNLSVNLSWLEVLSVEQTAVGITTTAAGKGWATLYTDKGLDFSNVDGLTAYTATIDNSTVTLNKVDDIQANTGVVLKSAAEDATTIYSVPVIASSTTDKGSMIGSTTDTELAASTAYILGINSDTGKAQFFINSAGTIAAGKAYLPVVGNGGQAKSLNVVFANDPTGIATVNAAESTQPVKRIVNGQLVIEKNGKKFNAAGAEF